MASSKGSAAPKETIDQTLARLVVMIRVLGWIWMVSLASVALASDQSNPAPGIIIVAVVVASAGTILTLVAHSKGFLGNKFYALADGIAASFVLASAWLSGASDFIAGGYPMSWLFILAYATDLRWTLTGSALATFLFAILHFLMDMDPTRIVGTIQFLVIGLVVGWGFDAIRHGGKLRSEAEERRRAAERALQGERERSARLQERASFATRLHDSVLQTLKLIQKEAEDPSEVRYLARAQERELRRTINEYRSPYPNGFKLALLNMRDEVEDTHRLSIEAVVRDDRPMDSRLEAVIEAAGEAMRNAARHSGSPTVDLYAESDADGLVVHIRDRGCGFDLEKVDRRGLQFSILGRMDRAGGTAVVNSTPGYGTDVELRLPL